MANNVFANGREISCKKADGKTICCFPDVCMTPPENPATPPGVPIPYPNTAFSKDASDGSKDVKISGQEIILKNKSFFKTSTGDEAGCAAKKGVVTSKIKGKAYFTAWSMDVKVEGENVVRHLDLTTHNHGSNTNTAPWTYLDRMSLSKSSGGCEDEINKAKEKCGNLKKKAECPVTGEDLANVRAERYAASKSGASRVKKASLRKKIKRLEKKLAGQIQKDPCQRAMRCFLTPFNSGHCCSGQTPDHLIEVKSFVMPGENRLTGKKRSGWNGYDANKAPCLCAEGGASSVTTHGVLSAKRKVAVKKIGKGKPISLEKAASIGARSASTTFKGCTEGCIKSQLLNYHENIQEDNAKVCPPAHGMGKSTPAKRGVLARAEALMK